jgi:hypothetical protein
MDQTAHQHHLMDSLSEAAVEVRHRARDGQFRAQQVVREHPLVSVGLALGGGLLLGAAGYRLLGHKQTFGEALAERAGVNRLRDRLRHLI